MSRALLAVTAVVATMFGGCGAATASLGSGTPAGTADPATIATLAPGATDAPATAALSDAGAECAIVEPPGPEDAPPASGEMNTSEQGPGRWRLCLTNPSAVTVETTAWCRWDEGRNQVEDVAGLPATAGTVEFDAFLTRASDLEIHLTDRAQGGIIANYQAGPGSLEIVPSAGMQGGIVRFEAILVEDPESGPPAGAPAMISGALRWLCGESPPG